MAPVAQTLIRLALLWFISVSVSWGAEPTNLIEETSESRQIKACAPSSSISFSLLSAAEALQDEMQKLYGVSPSPNTLLVIRAESWDYRVSDDLPSIMLWKLGPQVIIQLTFQQRPRSGLDELFRSLVEVTLYQSIYRDAQMVQGGRLIDLPLWLTEGILQGLLEGKPELNSVIIQRARRLQKSPSLETIMSWQKLSEDPVVRAWQQSFCWAACAYVFQHKEQSQALADWLTARAKNNLTAVAFSLKPEKETWKEFQLELGRRNEPLFYDWNQSVAALKEALVLQLPFNPRNRENEPAIDLTFDTLYENRTRYGFYPALSNKISELAALEVRVHFSIRRVIQDYLSALAPLQVPSELMEEYHEKLKEIQQSSQEDQHSNSAPNSVANTKPGPDSKLHPKNNKLMKELMDLNAEINQTKPSISLAEYRSRLTEAQRKMDELLSYKKGVDDYLNWFEVTQRVPMMDSSFEDYFQLSDKLDGLLNQTQSATKDELNEIEKKL